MADNFIVDSNAAEILRKFGKLPHVVQAGVKNGLSRALLIVEDRIRQRTQVKARRGAAGLMGRLTSKVTVDRHLGVDGVIGFRKRSLFPYELAQEFGASAKNGGAMAIPVSPEARRLSDRGISARDFPKTLIRPKHRGGGKSNVLIEAKYDKKAVGGIVSTVHYVLVKSIRPRLMFRQTVLQSADVINSEIVESAKIASKAI